MIRRLPLSTILLICAASTIFSQSTPSPAFEVASIRLSQASGVGIKGGARENIQFSPDSLTMRSVSMKSCIRWAYHVMDYQVSGPDSIGGDSARYDIIAKAPGAATEDRLRAMLQTLLADRFKLMFHRQSKELSGYVLLVGKSGPKFQESQTQGESRIDPDQRRMVVTVERTSLSQLVDMLTNILRAPVVDQTGLTGKYDISINVAKYVAEMKHGDGERMANDPPLDPIALIMRGLQEELGLKLEARKTAVDLLIVDHVEKAPTEN